MKYRTRNNSSPYGKPKVLMAHHPEEPESLIDKLSEDVLKYQNCTLWYLEPDENRTDLSDSMVEELLSRISEMQLIMIPVTTRLLTCQSAAKDIILPFAHDRNIPVLPVMTEGALEDLFTEVFGEIQYLEVNNFDITAIPYEERLQKYLETVLVGDEVAAKVRAAFDAYLFLSYRKKDRKYAQKLMRLIHDNPDYQQMAIWYDEYLTPGEDFNEAISNALEKSDAFVMVVTPNLLEDPNYVKDNEYPAAKQSGKEIAVFEMCPTDRNDLGAVYEGIPKSILPEEIVTKDDLLPGVLQTISSKDDREEPQQVYLIGLAYLNGIDVEVDTDRAFKMISKAAWAGEAKAMEELSDMFQEGKGVTRDAETSIRWMERCVDAVRRNFEKDKSGESYDRLFKALLKCGDKYSEAGRHEDALRTYQELLAIAKEQGTDDDLSASCNKLGDAYRELNDQEKAAGYYAKSMELYCKLAGESGTAWNNLAITYLKFADIFYGMNQQEIAKEYYEAALDIVNTFLEDPELEHRPTVRRSAALTLSKLGGIYHETGDFDSARSYYEKAAEIAGMLAGETKEDEDLHLLSFIFMRSGDLSSETGDPEEAKDLYDQALAIAMDLEKAKGTIGFRREVSAISDKAGDLCLETGDRTSAREYLEIHLDATLKLMEASGTDPQNEYCLLYYMKLGELALETGDFESAEKFYKEAETTAISMMRRGELRYPRDLAGICHNLGYIYLNSKKLSEAREYFENELEVIESMTQEEPGTLDDLENLISIYQVLAEISKEMGDEESAGYYYGGFQSIIDSLRGAES